eukprot:TRINITY_DN8040_c0_g1_i2.p1 TRINITY_DN8040_c0_g1~~TRINITY_DN8040_c0_g1_i2.p1  ORF type:complete len:339 (-),score=44.72 TRINITY_DN8040_c0_g1_i2:15-1031(-)
MQAQCPVCERTLPADPRHAEAHVNRCLDGGEIDMGDEPSDDESAALTPRGLEEIALFELDDAWSPALRGDAGRPPTPVRLNVYQLAAPDSAMHRMTAGVGLGLYHSGIEIYGMEWTFGGCVDERYHAASGIFPMEPQTATPFMQCSLDLGMCDLTPQQVRDIIRTMGREWTMGSYHLLARNCNHFAAVFCKALNPAFQFPGWVNRAAKVGDAVVPAAVLRYIMQKLMPQPPSSHPPSSVEAMVPHQQLAGTTQRDEGKGSFTSRPSSANDPMQLENPRPASSPLRTAEVDKFMDYSAKASQIVALLPDLELGLVLARLQRHNGDTEATLDELLVERAG